MISETLLDGESSYARTSAIMHVIIVNVLQYRMTWHASHDISDLVCQHNALLAATTICRASFNNASTAPVGTPFLLSTFAAGICALIKCFAFVFECNIEPISPNLVTLLRKDLVFWHAAIFGNVSTNSLTLEATEALAASRCSEQISF